MTQTLPTMQEKPPKNTQAHRPPPALPEERFWIRYSPHHELPLSGVSSIGIHVVIVTLLVLGAWLGWLAFLKEDKSLPVEAVTVSGGGGGSPRGSGDEAGARNPGELVEHQPDKKPDAVKPDDLKKVQAVPLQLPEIKEPDVRRLIDSGNDAVARISQLNQDTRARLTKGLRAGEGKGGGGSGGGTGRGTGTGTGDSIGPGSGTLSQREKRVLRWVMVFNTQNGEDYARQLHTLGTIVAIPEPGEKDKYRVIRKIMERPANPQPEDLAEIKRIYWVDNKPQSVDALVRALQLKAFPGHFVAFFPEQLEEKLLKMELAHARGRTEDQIAETKFEVRRIGNTYEPRLVDQKYLK